MPATIGTYNDWTYWRGVLKQPAKSVSLFGRPGVRGIGGIISAESPAQVSLEFGKLYLVANLADAITRQAGVRALAGTVVTTTDVFGNTYNSTLVIESDATIIAVNTGYLLQCTATVLPETSP